MNVDEFYVKSNSQFGWKQKIWFLGLSLYSFYVPFHMVQVVFTGIQPGFSCTVGNETLKNTCGPKSKCNSFNYSSGGSDSFLKEWSTSPCESAWVAKVVQSSFTLGILMGSTILGRCSDAYGRKKTLLYCLISVIILTVSGSYIPWLWVYAIFRFLQGFFSAGNLSSAFVLSSELVGPSMRGICGNIFQCFFGLGIIGLAALAYAIRFDWRILSLTCGLLGLLLVPIGLRVPESPRWLFAKGRKDEAVETLHILTGIPVEEIPIPDKNAYKSPDVLSIVHFVRLRFFCFVILLLSWFTNSIVYYALTLSQPGNFDVYFGTALSGVVEIPAYVLTAYLIDKVGRKVPLTAYMVVAGMSCIAAALTSWVYFSLVGKLCIAASFSIIYIHSNEIFPTVVRNGGIGICSSFARIGGIAASAFLQQKAGSFDLAYLGGLSILSGLLNMILPETLDKVMPETLEELDVNGIYRHKYSRLLPDDDHSEGEEDEELEYSRTG